MGNEFSKGSNLGGEEQAVLTTDIKEYPLYAKGKVRDVYDLGDKLLIIATDRISAFDVVLPNGIPGKGKILNSMSVFWFDYISDIIPHHLIASEVDLYPENLQKYRQLLEGRSMLVKKAKRIDIECVVRGYISGSLWKEYVLARQDSKGNTVTVKGVKFPATLIESAKLPYPIFTPATKASSGHDENISFEQMSDVVGEQLAFQLKEKSLAIYKKAFDYAYSKKIIIADTKFEFGILSDQLILIDEIFSPDSSRFWSASDYHPGEPQDSFDKQYIRDYLESMDWDKTPPAPSLPAEVIEKTLEKYNQAYLSLVPQENVVK